ncbi:MAG TPA: hypothetical protein VGR56_10360 [Nitrososphaerales archaeon]|nr:hypothetical protein [Nitrososphaerales archaeon]
MRRKKNSNRVKISFVATILVLTSIALIAYSFSFRIPSYSIPTNLPPYGGLMGKYAPFDSLQVSFANLTAIRAENASAVPNKQAVNLDNPVVTVRTAAVESQVLVTLLDATSGINNTAMVAVLAGGSFSNLAQGFLHSNLVPDKEGSYSIYHVNDSSNGRTKGELMTLVPSDSSVVFVENAADAKATILRVLSVREGQVPSILTVQNMTRMLFAVGGTNHLAISIQNFRGEVQTSRMGLLTVDVGGGKVQLTHVVQFASPSDAGSQVGRVQAVYRFASDYSQWEECIKAVETLSFSNLQGVVHLAGV